MSEGFPERMFARAHQLQGCGLDQLQAFGLAELEERLRQWPTDWGDDLRVLLYGDFKAPEAVLRYPMLGITVHPEKKHNTIIRGAITVLEATVKVGEKSVPSVVDAARRINLLLGTYTLHEWGNAGYGWWSYVTHGNTLISSGSILSQDGIETSVVAVRNLPPGVRGKVEAAMFWVREPRNLMLESYRSDVLRSYSSYWNAFECLVDAITLLKPPPTLSKVNKQEQIEKFFLERGNQFTAANVQECYQTIVNLGFVGKAAHALHVCFGSDADRYENECFRRSPQRDRLYDIRNAINHGDIDAENPNEVLRVWAKLPRLWMIIWLMFACMIPFPAPVDSKKPT